VTRSEAMLFTDSRYYLQAGNQLSSDWRLMKQEPSDPLIEDVIFDKLKGKKVGIDPYQFPNSKFKQWTEKWTKESAKLKRKDPSPSNNPPSLVPLPRNLVDAMWPTRPPIPQNPVKLHPDSLAGESVPSKLGRVRKAVSEESKADAIIISALDQIGWLFNLRGSDIMCNPVFFSYALVTSEGAAHLFLGRRDGNVDAVLDDEARAKLGESGVEIHAYSDFNAEFLPSLLPEKAYVLVEKGTCSVAIAECVERGGGSVVETEWCSPVELFKAKKNSAEIAGIRDSARRDSVAIVRFLAWLEEEVLAGKVYREAELANILNTYRLQVEGFVDESFETISSVGRNSSVIHYKAEAGAEDELELKAGDVYLLDSGGQYIDGTTDVTRTVCFGKEPTEAQRAGYTACLKGHIGLGSARFPVGTCGLVLDAFARGPLWQKGLDYGHGTGHGIGAYMNVHEGPFGISGSSRPGNLIRKSPFAQSMLLQPILEGYYMSNEPGYYVDGEFGFRIESDCVTVKSSEPGDGKKEYLQFETVTKVPMSRALTNPLDLSEEEKKWLNDYHSSCLKELTPLLKEDNRANIWLKRMCAPY